MGEIHFKVIRKIFYFITLFLRVLYGELGVLLLEATRCAFLLPWLFFFTSHRFLPAGSPLNKHSDLPTASEHCSYHVLPSEIYGLVLAGDGVILLKFSYFYEWLKCLAKLGIPVSLIKSFSVMLTLTVINL